VHSVSVNLDAAQYLAGWKPETGTLFLPTLSESRVGDEVAVRIGIYGRTMRATVFGKVSLVRRVGRPTLPPGVEVHLDRHSLAAAGFLAAAANGDPVSYKERLPRYAHERHLALQHAGRAVSAQTVNVSEGGCALRWTGQLPAIGDVVAMRLGEGLFAASARAVVCWSKPGGTADRLVGFRILPGGRGARAWRSLVAKVVKSGARTT
jgi:hypothetical protein